MPRDGSGIYTKPFPDVVTNTTIESAVHNGTINDFVTDLNAPRPIVAGGTGSGTVAGAQTNLQIVPSTGGTFTGNLTIDKGWPAVILDADPNTAAAIIAAKNGSLRWHVTAGNSAAETGSNAGSDFVITRYNDAAAWLGDAFFISRASGNVGIGTTNPARQLEVAGAIRLADNQPIEWSTAGYSITGSSGGAMLFSAGGTERMRIVAGGYVGIGTPDPQAHLHVSSGVVVFRLTDTNVANASWDLMAQTANTTKLFRIVDATAGQNRLVIDASGNVGIGTSSPGYKLDVTGQIRSSQQTIMAADSGYEWWNGSFATVGGYEITHRQIAAPNNWTNALTILPSGNVGIGTTSPGAKLDVFGGVNVCSGDTGGYLTIARYAGGYSYSLIKLGAGSDAFQFRDASDNPRVFIMANGNVAIGNFTPSYMLHVAGDICSTSRFRADSAEGIVVTGTNGSGSPYFHNHTKGMPLSGLSAGYEFHVQGVHYSGTWAGMQFSLGGYNINFQFRHDGTAWKPGGGQFGDNSDARIKTVKGKYTLGLDAICKLEPVIYTYKGNDTDAPPLWHNDTADFDEIERAKEEAAGREPEAPYRNSFHYRFATDGTLMVGLIAQNVEQFLPNTVKKQKGYIDGVEVDDLRSFDATEITYALINAVRELNDKIEALSAPATMRRK